jgi:hypothetical protein
MFGLAQNIMEPVEGQGIRINFLLLYVVKKRDKINRQNVMLKNNRWTFNFCEILGCQIKYRGAPDELEDL